MERGTAVHAIALGTRRVIPYAGRRAGKAWDEFAATNGDAEILTEKAYATAKAMADSLLAHPLFARGLADARARGGVEQTFVWEHLGVPCRGTPDLWVPEWVAEVKTSRTSDPEEWQFPRAALRAHYHTALAWYGEALRSTKRGDPKNYYIFAVEPDPPHVVTVFRLTTAYDATRGGRDGAYEVGDKTWRRWFEAYKVCRDANEWPPYSTAVCEIEVEQEMPALSFGGDDEDGTESDNALAAMDAADAEREAA